MKMNNLIIIYVYPNSSLHYDNHFCVNGHIVILYLKNTRNKNSMPPLKHINFFKTVHLFP